MKRLLQIVTSLVILVTAPAFAGEVVDLGSLQITGKMRGPEVQVIDLSRLHPETAENFIRWQLRQMESRTLVFDAPFTERANVNPPAQGVKP